VCIGEVEKEKGRGGSREERGEEWRRERGIRRKVRNPQR
jgi:hypothetical protein